MSESKQGRPPDTIFALLRYDSETGAFYRQSDGSRADRRNHYGVVAVAGDNYYAHRLAWFMAGRGWPAHTIDHINGDKYDNRLCNLREATHAQNNWNSRGYGRFAKGVCFSAKYGKFQAAITANRKRTFLGYFPTEQEAHAAYCKAAAALHGEFARTA